jgi:hypothetical protein
VDPKIHSPLQADAFLPAHFHVGDDVARLEHWLRW